MLIWCIPLPSVRMAKQLGREAVIGGVLLALNVCQEFSRTTVAV
jgi:hypothetical protein